MFKKPSKAEPKRDSGKIRSAKLNLSPWAKMFLGLLGAAVLLNAAGAYWAYDRYVAQVETRQLEQLAREQANDQAGHVSDFLESTNQTLRQFTDRAPFQAAVATDNQEGQTRYLDALSGQLPDPLTVRIFPEGTAKPDPDAQPPVGFAQVDMINRAEKREEVYPEAVKTDGTWHINWVQVIPPTQTPDSEDGEKEQPVMATLYVSLPADPLMSALRQANTELGQTRLLQTFPRSEPQSLAQVGQGNTGQTQTADIPASYWSVEFTPSAILAQRAQVNPTSLYGAMAGVALTSLLLCYLLANLLGRKSAARAEQMAAAQRATEEVQSEASVVDSSARQKRKMMEVEVRKEDASLLADDDSDPFDMQDEPAPSTPTEPPQTTETEIAAEIFRAYDIRGIVHEHLSPQNVVLIGRAIGSAALDAGDTSIIVGRDGRTHSNDISEQLIEGIMAAGCDVVNIGMVPTPLVYFAICEMDATNSGVMVTASHNPSEYNGFKIVINNETLAGDKIQALRTRILDDDFRDGVGREDFADVSFQYIEQIFSDVALAGSVSIVIDAGNGVAGDIAPKLFDELGCDVTPLFCEVDGSFPNHEADPSNYNNLQDLIAKVQEVGADLGIALDGDGDRLGVVTASGDVIAADRLLMLLAKDIVARNPGTDVLFDVKSSRELNNVITSYGGRPMMWKTGHSHMKARMQETGALLGGELSGHIFIKERWYGFDDGMYTAARLLEIMSLREQSLDEIFEAFPALPATPEIKVAIDEDKKFGFIQKLLAQSEFADGKLTTIDGLRVDFPNSWGLVRASNTSPSLTLRFEAETEEALAEIKERFKEAMLRIDPSLPVNF